MKSFIRCVLHDINELTKDMTTKTLTLSFIQTADVPSSPYRWIPPDAVPLPGITLVPDDTKKLRLTTDIQTGVFEFEYVVRDGTYDRENPYDRVNPRPVKMRVRFWRLKKSQHMVDAAFCDRDHSNEYNFGCGVLKTLNEGLGWLHRGRYIANSEGKSIIQVSNLLRRSPTVKDSPYNYGNPLMGPNEDEETEYDAAGFEYYYGMFGSKEYGMTERDDQDAVAIFPV